LLTELRSVKSQTYFILQFGYFKAKSLFFTFNLREVEEDVQYILQQYFNNTKIDIDSTINKRTRLKHQRLILQLVNYRSCDSEQRQVLAEKAQQAAMVCSKPVYVFQQLMHYLQEQRIVAPGYSFMQDTVGKALTSEQARLTTIVRHHLQTTDREALNLLLADSEGRLFSAKFSLKSNEITQLKREPKDFRLSEIKREIHRGEQIRNLYRLAEELLPPLLISNESIKHYASLVTYYSVFRLKRFDDFLVYLYLLCFVYHRYQRLHDNLINSLIYNVRGYVDEAKAVAKERVYQYRIEANSHLQKAGQVLKLFTNDSISEETPFHPSGLTP